jgi:hypothetical protein
VHVALVDPEAVDTLHDLHVAGGASVGGRRRIGGFARRGRLAGQGQPPFSLLRILISPARYSVWSLLLLWLVLDTIRSIRFRLHSLLSLTNSRRSLRFSFHLKKQEIEASIHQAVEYPKCSCKASHFESVVSFLRRSDRIPIYFLFCSFHFLFPFSLHHWGCVKSNIQSKIVKRYVYEKGNAWNLIYLLPFLCFSIVYTPTFPAGLHFTPPGAAMQTANPG